MKKKLGTYITAFIAVAAFAGGIMVACSNAAQAQAHPRCTDLYPNGLPSRGMTYTAEEDYDHPDPITGLVPYTHVAYEATQTLGFIAVEHAYRNGKQAKRVAVTWDNTFTRTRTNSNPILGIPPLTQTLDMKAQYEAWVSSGAWQSGEPEMIRLRKFLYYLVFTGIEPTRPQVFYITSPSSGWWRFPGCTR